MVKGTHGHHSDVLRIIAFATVIAVVASAELLRAVSASASTIDTHAEIVAGNLGLEAERQTMLRGEDTGPFTAADETEGDRSRVLAPSPLDANFVALGGSVHPSDGALAVGPSHVLEIVNGLPGTNNVGIYDKTGRALTVTTLPNLMGLDSGTLMSDPRAFYDLVSARWYVLSFGINPVEFVARFYLAISLSADPLGGFCEFSKDESVQNGVSGVVAPDFPGMGMDDYAMYVTTTRFRFSDDRAADTQVEMFPRSELGCGQPALRPWVWSLTTTLPDGNALWEVQPANAFGAPGSGYLVGTSWTGGSYAGIWTISHAASPQLVRSSIPIGPYLQQVASPQPGTSFSLDTSDTRVPSSPVFRNGSLWFAFTARSTRSAYGAIRWYELKTPSMAVAQQGEIWNTTSNWSYPAVMVDANGGLVVNASSVGPQDFPNASLLTRAPTDPPGVVNQPQGFTSGSTSYVGDGGRNPARWGDYFGIALDPDGLRVWAQASYSRTSTTWQTSIAATRVTAPALRAASFRVVESDPNPIAGAAVTVTAQALDQSGAPLPAAGLVVNWSASPVGNGSFASPSSTTNASGSATVQFTTSPTAAITYTITATGVTGGVGASAPFTTKPKPAPTSTLYLPNVTKTLGGPNGFQTPFIVQNIGAVNTNLEISFFRFANGSLVTHRVVTALAPGASYADVPNNDADLPGDTQFSVRVDSFGAPIVSVVNQHNGLIEADAYSAASSGATTVYLPNVVRRFFGFHSPIIIQNLGSAVTTAVAVFKPFAGGPSPAISRTIAPGQSQFIEPNVEGSLTDGTQYSVTVTATQPIAVVVNTHNDDAGVAHPYFYSANGITAGAASLYGAYAVKNANGGRTSTIVVQNVGTTPSTPAMTFTPFGGGPAKTFMAPAALSPGTAWAFDPRFSNGVATTDSTKACSSGATNCLPDGEYSFKADAAGGSIAAMVNIIGPDSAMGYTASAAPATTYFLPNVLANYFGWTTPVILQSVTARTATLTWTPFTGGAPVARIVSLIPGQSLRIDPVSSVVLGRQYSVKVVADGQLTAIVMELNGELGGDNAMTYSGFAGTP